MTRLDRTNAPHHVYRCYDRDGRLVYVGSSANLFGRLNQHRSNAWWAPTVVNVKAQYYPSGIVARQVESRAIREEVPRWNKQGKWVGRHLWTRQDWLDWITIHLHGISQTPRHMPAGVTTAITNYESLFQESLPEPFASRIRTLEVAIADRQERDRAEHARRMKEVEREDELSLARERKDRAEMGIPVDCVCMLSEIAAGGCEDCDADHSKVKLA